MLKRHALAGTLTLAMVIALSGCALHLNKPDGMYGTTLPALAAAPASAIDETPSIIAGHDRSHWRRMTVAVPLRQVEHHPTFTHELLLRPTTYRAAGAFPTVETALEVDAQTGGRMLESPLNIIGAGALIVWAPIDMIVNHRWPLSVERASASEYQRLVMIEDPVQFQRWLDVEDRNAQGDDGAHP